MGGIFFPTTDFLGKIEISNEGLLEDRYSKDQQLFEILGNRSYCNARLHSNFNNKLYRFIDEHVTDKATIINKIIRFYEYKTFAHQFNGRHQDIATGYNSWTLSYYIAAILAIYRTLYKVEMKWSDIVITGDIGDFSDWSKIERVTNIQDKLFVTIREIISTDELSSIKAIPFFYVSDEIIDIQSIKDRFRDLPLEIVCLSDTEYEFIAHERRLTVHLYRISDVVSLLNLIISVDTSSHVSYTKQNKSRFGKYGIIAAGIFVIIACSVIISKFYLYDILTGFSKAYEKGNSHFIKARSLKTYDKETFEEYVSAIYNYDLAKSIRTDCVQCEKNKGIAYYCMLNYEEAEKILVNLLRTYPLDSDLNYYVGRLQLMRGEKQKAKTKLTYSIMKQDNHADAHSALASIYLSENDIKKAKQHIDKSLMLINSKKAYYYKELNMKSDKAFALLQYGVYCAKNNKFTDALSSFNEAIAIRSDPEIFSERSSMLKKMGQLELAQKDYNKALTERKNAEETRARISAWMQQKAEKENTTNIADEKKANDSLYLRLSGEQQKIIKDPWSQDNPTLKYNSNDRLSQMPRNTFENTSSSFNRERGYDNNSLINSSRGETFTPLFLIPTKKGYLNFGAMTDFRSLQQNRFQDGRNDSVIKVGGGFKYTWY